MTTGEQRPGDAARRALRAARERAEAERDGAAPGTPRTRPPAPSDEKGTPAPEAPVRAHEEAQESAGTPVRRLEEASGTAGTPVRRLEEASGTAGTPVRRHEEASGTAGTPVRRHEEASGTAGTPVRRHEEASGTAGTPPRTHQRAPGTAEAPSETAEDRPVVQDRSAAEAPRPGDIARAALRAAVAAARSTGRDEDSALPAEESSRAGGAGDAGMGRTAGTAGETRTAGTEPAAGDAARQALRAARSEALRAGTAPGMPRGRAKARATGASARTTPGPDRPGGESGTARAEAAREMRQFLTNAFRMPSWEDTSEEGDATGTQHAVAHDTDMHAPAPARGDHRPTDPDPDPGSAGAAAPRVPTTMATPHRDSELRRTFPALGPGPGSAGAPDFAETWWGNAWIDALERGALDPGRLARGRGYAEQGNVDAITVTPGTVLAYVRGSRPRPYRVQVRLRTLEDHDWERFLDAAADRPGHIAALLDKELPQSLADCGVPLLPGPGDLASRCSCPDSGHPCKHAAALCYQTARLLDADPFVLLLLRGRGERELLDALSRRSAARGARAAQQGSPRSLPGVRATDALAPGGRPPLPAPLPPVPHPEQPPVYPAAPGGPDPFALDQLATDAAARAHALLATGRDPVGELTLWEDAVRLAAARPGSGLTATSRALYATLAEATGRTPADLARAVAAWRQGGLAGLAVLDEPWDPPAGRFDRARPLLLAADLPAFRPWRNHLTHPQGHVQLRLGRDGLWYAYESEPGQDDWWPRGTPDLDPVGALTGLGTPDDL
ncbi:SWIM zinc finger family protein [Streptomyces collinus]|uniref:SWIM zinc finger family protein n=1 Tax=Streptomyces collinus TaxID=42684 RepID=UPI0036C1AD0E